MKKNYEKSVRPFNIILAGVGGQGLVTLAKVLARSAMAEGLEIRTSELHGLSQRRGSIEVHARMGEKIHSPLVPAGRADLVLSLEKNEAYRKGMYVGKKTIFLSDSEEIPYLQSEEFKGDSRINPIFAPATQSCKRELGIGQAGGIMLLGCAVKKKIIPLSGDSVKKAINEVFPEELREINLRAFDLAV